MVLCIFTIYGMIPRAVHEMNPNSFTYKLITALFENSGLLFRKLMGVNGKRGSTTATGSPS